MDSDLVAVVWEDACTVAGWEPNSIAEYQKHICVSVGLLVVADDDGVKIAGSFGGEDHNNSIMIPIGMVRHVIEFPEDFKKKILKAAKNAGRKIQRG